MNKGLLVTTAIGLVLVGGIARAQTPTPDQNDDNTWDGPGYYAEDLATQQSNGTQILFKDGGPFASYDACQTFLQQDDTTSTKGWTDSYQCVYRGSSVQYAPPIGCFLTTACVEHAGLRDDCDELTLMRALRDRYLDKFDEGRLVIDQYYRIAPLILERMRRAPNRSRALAWILREVRATAHSVACGEMEMATVRYAAMVARLQQRYGVMA
ncbi:MAG: hypothetical protein KGL29_09135 [Alphaproteobacteria bacterium]|nr:hypothetical protein [Alphaproteobacteria bacterium]MDE2266049.1 hypothetical protein [Alphaproteobacteria bacterium]MDE2499925.1 hypothetical protein [Alphaproteobacteria bacterium]